LGGFTATAFKMEKQQDDSQEIEQPQNHQVVMNRFVAACQADERVVAAFLHQHPLAPWVEPKHRGRPNQSDSTTNDNASSVTTANWGGSAQRMTIDQLDKE
jgi:hypothetical protein